MLQIVNNTEIRPDILHEAGGQCSYKGKGVSLGLLPVQSPYISAEALQNELDRIRVYNDSVNINSQPVSICQIRILDSKENNMSYNKLKFQNI